MISLQEGDGRVWSLISLQVGDYCYIEPNQTHWLNFPYFYWHGFLSIHFSSPKLLNGGLEAGLQR
jgi:hypothetical protein